MSKPGSRVTKCLARVGNVGQIILEAVLHAKHPNSAHVLRPVTGIVHIGLGAFFRGFGCVYVAEAVLPKNLRQNPLKSIAMPKVTTIPRQVECSSLGLWWRESVRGIVKNSNGRANPGFFCKHIRNLR